MLGAERYIAVTLRAGRSSALLVGYFITIELEIALSSQMQSAHACSWTRDSCCSDLCRVSSMGLDVSSLSALSPSSALYDQAPLGSSEDISVVGCCGSAWGEFMDLGGFSEEHCVKVARRRQIHPNPGLHWQPHRPRCRH